MGLICFDMIALKPRGETFGMAVRQCGDNVVIALFCRRGSRRPLGQCIPQMIAAITLFPISGMLPSALRQKRSKTDLMIDVWSNSFDTTCPCGTHGDTKIAGTRAP